jgi:energy-coupling factor transporter ATP-binding protein EcfA2
MLEIQNLTVRYSGQSESIIKDVNLKVGDSEILWLRGPNGSGKTTLLYAISNIIPQEIAANRQGEIFIDSKPTQATKINQMCPHLSISMANPRWELFFGKPAEEIIFALENIGLPTSDIQSRLDHVIALFHLQSIMDTESHRLSFGWQKMLSLAVQAAIKPRVLLLDEPLNGLSETNKTTAISWLREFLQEGGSLIVAEQDNAISKLNPTVLMLG